MSASNKASKQTQAQLIVKYLNTHQRLQLIYTVAKSEVQTISLQTDQTFWTAIYSEINDVCLQETVLTDQELYLCCIFILSASHLNKLSEITKFLSNLMMRAQNHLTKQLYEIQTKEEASEIEVSLSDNEDLQAQMDFIIFVLRKGVVKYDLKNSSKSGSTPLQIQQVFIDATKQLTEFIHKQKDSSFVQLTQFAPYAIWFEVLYDIFWALKNSGKSPLDLFKQGSSLTELLKVTFDVLLIYKTNSQYYMVTIGSVMSKQNNSQTGEQTVAQSAVRRMSKLFTEILDLLVSFMSAYLTTVPLDESNDCIKIYELLIKEKDGSTFTLIERLTIMSELNFLFQKIEVIQKDHMYWQTIREGLYDLDQACRKLSLNILKSNLKQFQEQTISMLNTKSEFELLWSTFFDIYDTLESFGSHLTKAVWHRTELFYKFMSNFDQAYSKSSNQINPLEDMRMWLLVIYHRVASHNNIKVRRFVQKATLKRQYITPHMTEFFFNEFVCWLNQCLIFRDVNNYTTFSKNAHTVIDFYARYFKSESKDLSSDLKHFFLGFSRNKSHSQMTLICLKVLSSDYPGELRWIKANELRILLEMIDSSFHDQVLSGRYLCFKFIIRMMSYHFSPNDIQDEWTTFFKMIGNMPLEFFSPRTTFDDIDARESASRICQFKTELIQTTICEYLKTLYTVKAMSVQMPKFGKDADLVLTGICKILMCFDDESWLAQTTAICLDAIDQMLESTYLQTKLVEQKIRYFVKFCQLLFEHGSQAMKGFAYSVFVGRAGKLMDRFTDYLIVPLYRDDQLLASEQEKIEAILAQLSSYANTVSMAIKMIHLQDNRQENQLKAFLVNIIKKAVYLTSAESQIQSPWSFYLLQLGVLEILQSILKSYAHGIKKCLSIGKTQIFIQEEIFTMGRNLLQNLIQFKVNIKANGNDSITKDQEHFMTELDYNPSKINQKNTFNSWQILAYLLNIFQFDGELRQELASVQNKRVSEKTLNFLDSVTSDYNPHMFFILKTTFIPQILQLHLSGDFVQAIEDYQQVVRQCWSIVKQQRTEITAEELIEFLQLAFNQEILEGYQIMQQSHFVKVQKFYADLAKEMLDYGSKYWLILRAFFNHLMAIFIVKPHLIKGLESFICAFGTTRECRSTDAEIKLEKLEKLHPSIVPTKFANLPFEYFNHLSLTQVAKQRKNIETHKNNPHRLYEYIIYQGAYIRTLTLIIIEEIIQKYIDQVKSGNITATTERIGEALTTIILSLLNLNLDKKQMAKSDQPFSDPHRLKLRTWQMLTVMQNLITETSLDLLSTKTIQNINDALWPILKQNHLANVRQYMECFTIKFVLRYPDLTLNEGSLFYETCLETKSIKPALTASLLLIAGFALLHTDTNRCLAIKRRIFDKLIGFAGSNSAHCRSIAQYFILKLNQIEPALIGSALQPLMKYMSEAKDINKMMGIYQKTLDDILYKQLKLSGAMAVLHEQLQTEGEHIGINLIEELNRQTTEVMCEFRSMDEIPIERRDWWKSDLELRKKTEHFDVTIQEESQNYQRKILPWEQVEFDATLQKRVFFQRRRQEMIICATLIDKVANLAGLARTSEIMNTSSLIINNSEVCQLEEFKGISVTSEKWLPIYEVKEKDLHSYLSYQKANGFKIVGVEQTAKSTMLHEFKFPTRCVLLLGKEKEGIPQEYYSLLDFCVEVPQYGIVRSLSVHVTGALCLWEYTRQHMFAPEVKTELK